MTSSFAGKEKFPIFQTEVKPDSDVLIISFSGLFGFFDQMRPFDFFMITKMLAYNRIMLRDPAQLFYLRGIDETGFDGLLERLRSEIKRINAKTLLFVGASSGGYAAILFGHLLGADYVHAFGARGHLKIGEILRQRDCKAMINRMHIVTLLNCSLPPRHRFHLDLKPLLYRNVNPDMKINLHACAHCIDAKRARHLKDCPNTKIFLYPCNTHRVAASLIKSGCLRDYFKKENLDQSEDVYQKYYGDFAASREKISA